MKDFIGRTGTERRLAIVRGSSRMAMLAGVGALAAIFCLTPIGSSSERGGIGLASAYAQAGSTGQAPASDEGLILVAGENNDNAADDTADVEDNLGGDTNQAGSSDDGNSTGAADQSNDGSDQADSPDNGDQNDAADSANDANDDGNGGTPSGAAGTNSDGEHDGGSGGNAGSDGGNGGNSGGGDGGGDHGGDSGGGDHGGNSGD